MTVTVPGHRLGFSYSLVSFPQLVSWVSQYIETRCPLLLRDRTKQKLVPFVNFSTIYPKQNLKNQNTDLVHYTSNNRNFIKIGKDHSTSYKIKTSYSIRSSKATTEFVTSYVWTGVSGVISWVSLSILKWRVVLESLVSQGRVPKSLLICLGLSNLLKLVPVSQVDVDVTLILVLEDFDKVTLRWWGTSKVSRLTYIYIISRGLTFC